MHIIFLSQDDADNGSVNDEDYSYVDDIMEMVIFLRHAFVLSSLLSTQGD